MSSPSNPTLFIVVAAIGIAAGVALLSCTQKRESQPENQGETSEKTVSGADKQEPGSSVPEPPGSTLELGRASRGAGVISIPLEFTSGLHESVGTITAQLKVPDGPWKFQKAKAPQGSRLEVAARHRRSQDAAGGGAVIELEISAGSREVPDGVVGYLTFSETDGSAPDQIPITVAKMETAPPGSDTEPLRSAAPTEIPATPDSAAPAPGCFFFTH